MLIYFTLERVSLADKFLIKIYQVVTYSKLCFVWLGFLADERKGQKNKFSKIYHYSAVLHVGHGLKFCFCTHLVPIYDKGLKKK